MDIYSEIEQQNLNKFKDNIVLQKEKQKELNEENEYYELLIKKLSNKQIKSKLIIKKLKNNNNINKIIEYQKKKNEKIEEKINYIKNNIKKNKRRIISTKAQITRNNNKIKPIASIQFFNIINEHIFCMIFDQLNKNNFDISKIYFVNKKIRKFCLENYITIINYFKTYSKNKLNKIYYVISNKVFKDNNLSKEQILYLSSKNFNQYKGKSPGRSIIHLLVRNNKLDIMKCLIEQFSNLNLNIGTIVDNWHPLHNAIYFNNKGDYTKMIELLLSQGITKNWNMTYNNKYKFTNFKDYNNMIYNKNFVPILTSNGSKCEYVSSEIIENLTNDKYTPYDTKFNNIIIDNINEVDSNTLYNLYYNIERNVINIENIKII